MIKPNLEKEKEKQNARAQGKVIYQVILFC
jgi:hypothetical protein